MMYSRNFNRTQRNENPRYNPPPGYVGTAFSGKYHKPTQEVGAQDETANRQNSVQDDFRVRESDPVSFEPHRPQSERYEQQERIEDGIRQENIPIMENEVSCRGEDKKSESADSTEKAERTDHAAAEKSPLYELIEILRGKIGTEELIILMVMLLVASDGVGVEVLILALALLAG